LIGPAIGGLLVGFAKTTVVGTMLAYLVQGLMQLISVVGLGAIRREFKAPHVEKPLDMVVEIRMGARWLLGNEIVSRFAVLTMALNFLFGPVTIAIIVLAKEHYSASAESIGLLFSVAGIAGLGATIAAPWIKKSARVGHIVVGSVIVWAVGMLVMPSSDSLLGLALGWAIVTGVGGVYDVVAISYRLALIPDNMQGRVNSVFRFVGFGIRPVALVVGGFMIAAVGARETLWIIALGLVITAVVTASSKLRSVV